MRSAKEQVGAPVLSARPPASRAHTGTHQVETIDPLHDARWPAFIDASLDAGIFHHPGWLELLHAQYRYPFLARCVVDADGEILAALPFAHVQSRITGARLVAVPFSDLCAPATRGDDGTAVDRLVDFIRAQHERDRVDVEIRAPVAGTGVPGSSFYHHVVALGPDPEAVRSDFKSSVRRAIAKAERQGVGVMFGTDRRALDDFYRLHLHTRRRQGVPTQPKRFIRRFEELFQRGLGFVLLARFEDETIAAAVFLTFNGVLTYKYGASGRSHWEKRPNNALMMKAIEWGCVNGCHSFDLGRTDVENEGLRSFKRGWGADERLLTYTRFSRQRANGSHGVPAVARTFITHTPPIAGRLAGAALYRHFG